MKAYRFAVLEKCDDDDCQQTHYIYTDVVAENLIEAVKSFRAFRRTEVDEGEEETDLDGVQVVSQFVVMPK